MLYHFSAPNRVYNDEYYKGLTLSNHSVNVLSEYLFVCRGLIVEVNFFFWFCVSLSTTWLLHS